MNIDEQAYEDLIEAQDAICDALKRIDDPDIQDSLRDIFDSLDDLLSYIEAERSF